MTKHTSDPGHGPYCAKCGLSLDEDAAGLAHMFCGYGYMIQFHPECCPIEHHGDICEYPHPKKEVAHEPIV